MKNSILAFLVIVFIPFFMSTIINWMTGLLKVLQLTSLGKNDS